MSGFGNGRFMRRAKSQRPGEEALMLKTIPVEKIKELIAGFEQDRNDWCKELEESRNVHDTAEAASAAYAYKRVIRQLKNLVEEAK